ncbi:MAG: OprO/OprP family phosphate-selective porin [Gammaproteobacteria bacterium]|nr:OprO/OprP family phosphate-selective porin [Gammaproteobacteria bacterium]
MKQSLITLAIVAAVAVPMTVSAAEAKFFGFSQITAAVGKGAEGNDDNDGLRFGADRIRIGYKIKQGNAWGKLQADFNKTDDTTNIGVDEIIKDAVVGYKFNDAANVMAGVFKTPVGMDFNTSGKSLDITKRGMEKKLVLERAAGLMVSGRNLGGFGYDVGVFNPTQRSSAVDFGGAGDAMAYAGRVMYDMGDSLHIEASYGTSTQDSGSAAEDYTVFDVAASYKINAMTFKAEYILGSNVRGADGDDESVWYLHGGYAFNDTFEGVVRHYNATQDYANGNDFSLGNTYIGANIYLAEKNNARIQLNYVLASGDTDGADVYSGVAAGYTDDIFLAQFQVGF